LTKFKLYKKLPAPQLSDQEKEKIEQPDFGGTGTVAFSQDNRWLALGSWDKKVHLWDWQNPEQLDTPQTILSHDDWVWSLAFSRDGRKLAAGCRNGTVRLWDLGQLNRPEWIDLSLYDDKDSRKQEDNYRWEREVFAVAFSPKGELVLGSRDGKVRVCRDIHSPILELLPQQDSEGIIRSLAFSRDGQWLAAGRDSKEIWLWNWVQPEAEPILLRQGHFLGVSAVAFAQNDQMLVSVSWDGEVRLWELCKSKVAPTILPHEGEVRSVAISPDGMWLASGSFDKKIRLWSMSQPHEAPIILSSHDREVSSIAFDSEGKRLVSGSYDKTVRLWDLTQLGERPVEGSVIGHHEGEVMAVAFSPDGTKVASGSYDTTVRLWDVQEKKQLPAFRGHTSEVRAVAFSPDGRWLVSGSYDKTVRFWKPNLPDNEPKYCLPIPQGGVRSIAFSKDGNLLVLGTDTQIVLLWDLKPFLSGGEPMLLCQVQGSSVTFSLDDRMLTSGSQDGTIRVWEVQALLEAKFQANPIVLQERGHTGFIRSLAFNKDGTILVSGSDDQTIRLWTLKTEILAEMVCQKVWRNLTEEEWKDFVGEELPYEATCHIMSG
jgi:WD40 repeat protein